MASLGPRTLFLGVFIFALLAQRAGAEESQGFKLLIPRTNYTGPGPNDYVCESERGPDFYGIGVRLGIYFLWFTAWIANIWMPGEISGALDANSVFLFVNIVSMVRCAITQVLTQLDTLVMMHMSSGFLFGVNSIWGYRTCFYAEEGPKGIRHFGGFGTHFRLGLSLAVSIFGLWFWMYAIRRDADALFRDDGPCATVYTFMFAKVVATGGIRVFYIIMCLCCSIYYGAMLIVSSLAGYARVSKIVKLVKLRKFRTTTRLRYATGLKQKHLRGIFKFLRVGNFLYIIYSMLLIEFTLTFNHVSNVLGPGGRIYFPSQLIPMLIGAFSFLRLIYRMVEQWRDPDDNPSLPAITPIANTHQDLPHGKKVYKMFAPPTQAVQPKKSPRDMPPEDNDIDLLLAEERTWIRYLASWLPWLSLLWQKDDFSVPRRQNVHERTDHPKNPTRSPSSTAVGSPTTPKQLSTSSDHIGHFNSHDSEGTSHEKV